MRTSLLLLTGLALGACTTDPTSGAAGTYSVEPMIISSRLATSFGTVGGAPYRLYTIRFVGVDACEAVPIATYEIDLASTGNAIVPLGDIPLRTSDPPSTVPSAIQRSGTATVISGTLSITQATGTLLDGTIDAQVMLNGTPTALTASFIAPTCP